MSQPFRANYMKPNTSEAERLECGRIQRLHLSFDSTWRVLHKRRHARLLSVFNEVEEPVFGS